ncbi:hypothetical protein ACWFRT_10275 [Streptomyces anulatus]|uniref:hypothetical protein n=1 Tax=Streptomyces anulatus TaxID=1892 RepID=UPI003636AF13
MVEVTLTGAQLVDYLKVLEQDISGGPGAKRSVEVLSRRMYEAIAPVVARRTSPSPIGSSRTGNIPGGLEDGCTDSDRDAVRAYARREWITRQERWPGI